MYVLVHNNRVIAGPMAWNRPIFEGNLQKLNIPFGLGREAPPQLPLVITDTVKIYATRLVYPEFDKRVEYLHGPFWQFTHEAVGTFQINPITLGESKQYLKTIIADNRYKFENQGITINIKNTQVKIPTARENRDIFYQNWLSMGENSTVEWKFDNIFLTLNKSELQQISTAIFNHVQNAFTWESNKWAEIDSCTTAAAIKNVILEP
jgi:hypothetical protein